MNIFDDYFDWAEEQRFGPMGVPEKSLTKNVSSEPNVADIAKGVTSKIASGVAEDVIKRPLQSVYGAGKGAIEGTIGQFGDFESLIKGVLQMAQTPEGASKLEQFIIGAEKPTVLPTTEEIGQYTEKVLPPSNAPFAEGVGEVISPAKTIIKGTKKLAKGISKMTKSSNETRVKYDANGKRVAQ